VGAKGTGLRRQGREMNLNRRYEGLEVPRERLPDDARGEKTKLSPSEREFFVEACKRVRLGAGKKKKRGQNGAPAAHLEYRTASPPLSRSAKKGHYPTKPTTEKKVDNRQEKGGRREGALTF